MGQAAVSVIFLSRQMVKLIKPQIRTFHRWFKLVLAVLFIFAALAGGYYLVFKSDFLIIKTVNCSVKDKTSLADERRWCETAERLLFGKRIFLPNQQALADEIGRKFLPVGEISIKKNYPQTVAVTISERKPTAKVANPGGAFYLVDKEAVIFAQADSEISSLSEVILDLGVEPSLGSTIASDILELVRLEEPKVLQIKYIGANSIEVKSGEVPLILFSRQKEISQQIRSLQIVSQKYKIEGKELKKIDLRFDKTVVEY